MQRMSYAQPPACKATPSSPCHSALLQMPIYIMHAPVLKHRHDHMRQQLVNLHAVDVTWVYCANKEDLSVSNLGAEHRRCLHPCMAPTHWTKVNTTTGAQLPMPEGTLSLAVKHKLAQYDMLRRWLPSALLLEDDAVLPADLWSSLARFALPADADIFYLGSYSSRTSAGTLSEHPRVASKQESSLSLHWRDASRFPAILGTIAYVLFASGARRLTSQPVLANADIAVSFFPFMRGAGEAEARCVSHGVNFTLDAPPTQVGPARWLVWPASKAVIGGGGTHHD